MYIEKVVKRNGDVVSFDKQKIIIAIMKAMTDSDETNKGTALRIANDISKTEQEKVTVEEIQDMVEEKLMKSQLSKTARHYIRWRFKREMIREGNTTDKTIKELLCGENEYWNSENANKNAKLVTTQRDYIAGITSTDISRRFLLPDKICKAHDDGIIHIHDMDYMAENTRTNCCLVNLEDMLQNGTVINGVTIGPQHRLLTATTVATQIITAVSSSQYGGVTITLTHLAPFVRKSYEEHYELAKEFFDDDESRKNYADKMTKKEVRDSVQTFNYQVNSMATTNGQAPFLSVMMYLDEDPEYKKEVAMLIEEFLKQRIKGMQNEQGVWVTPAFPKLLYVLDEDNIHEDSEYWYLTVLAAKCTAKRMVPDYISAKIMKELKINQYGDRDVYPCINLVSNL